ncbi:hypothetical protein GCM10009759_68970 [Kitasatospora saccharophila]|uniref:Uncharacterized protein n=1 Tax=Kitasatospora saccharophila TaxID=407973 RepID=A0ABN2Y0B9_9ACTN
MLTRYTDEGDELRAAAVKKNFNCPPDLEAGRLDVERIGDIAALVSARPTVYAANQELLALLNVLPRPDDSEFWWAVQKASNSLDLHPGNLPQGVKLTLIRPVETALAGRLLAGLTELTAEQRADVALLIGERLEFFSANALRLGELWIQAAEAAAFKAVVAGRFPRTPEEAEEFTAAWKRD